MDNTHVRGLLLLLLTAIDTLEAGTGGGSRGSPCQPPDQTEDNGARGGKLLLEASVHDIFVSFTPRGLRGIWEAFNTHSATW